MRHFIQTVTTGFYIISIDAAAKPEIKTTFAIGISLVMLQRPLLNNMFTNKIFEEIL
jgi:hypothetical protein